LGTLPKVKPLAMSPDIRWLCETTAEGHTLFRIGRDGSEWVAEFAGVGTLYASPGGTTFRFEATGDANPDQVAKVRHGLSLGLLRHLQGKLTLHASSAARHGRAIVCAGNSGSGKSTTIAELCARTGWSLLSDDVALVDSIETLPEITPAERLHWLLQDSRAQLGISTEGAPVWSVADTRSKRPIAPARVADRPARCSAICSLVFDDDASGPSLRRLHGSDAASRLLVSCIRFALDDAAAHQRELDQVIAVLERVPVYELRRPHRLQQLRAAGDLLEILAGDVATSAEGP
jgi:hypothetical protein